MNAANPTATLLAAFDPSVPTVAQLGGTTQRLSNGHTLAAYGNGNRVEEYDASGRVVWQIPGERRVRVPGPADRVALRARATTVN